MGLALLVGITGFYNVRLLGMAKNVPLTALHKLMPWGIFGFSLCLVTGLIFVDGNSFKPPIVLFRNIPFLFKMLFMAVAGANAATFYLSPVHAKVKALDLGEDTPRGAKVIAATSLSLRIAIIYLGRMIPWEEGMLYSFIL